jgi:hypothetical protein
MEVTTSAPILIDGQNNIEDYYNANANRRARNRSRRRRGEGFGQNLQRLLKNPFVQNLASAKLGIKPVEDEGGNTGSSIPDLPSSGEPMKAKQGMSTGVKVAIGVGILAVIGVAVYFVLKNKKGKAKTT